MSKKRKKPYSGEAYHKQLISKFIIEYGWRIVNSYAYFISELTNTDPNNMKYDVDDNGDHLIFTGENAEHKAYFRNLLLEIVTIDRDDTPLLFDFKLNDKGYRLHKISNIVMAKAEVFSTAVNAVESSNSHKEIRQALQEYYDSHKSTIQSMIIKTDALSNGADSGRTDDNTNQG